MKRALANVKRATRRKDNAADAYLAAIVQARQEGATFQQIADAAGCKVPNVWRIIQRHTKEHTS